MTVIEKDVKDLDIRIGYVQFIIKYPDVNYSYWKMRIPYDNDIDLSIILDNILVNLDCTITFSNQRLLMTTNMMYDYHVSEYYYYLLHLENQILYNHYFDLLLVRHIDNIKFELDNPIIINVPKEKAKRSSKVKVENKFVRQITTNMFDNKETYIYSNAKTGETIQSDNPDLLESLNAKPVKEKRTRVVGVPMEAMTFSFKKKE